MPPSRDPLRVPDPRVDYERLADGLAALAYPLRLELLDVLRFRHTLGEIRVSPHRVEPGGNPDRPAAKPTILAHLEKLIEAGLVRVEEHEEGGRPAKAYVVVPQRMYAVVEELRRIVTHHAGHGVGEDRTAPLAGGASAPRVAGPRLVLVHGLYEGKAFPLRDDTARDGAWAIGRAKGLPVSLDYDPFVSLENAAIERAGDGFRVRDLPGSRNGTSLNWEALPRGGARPLATGDVLGVGRSRLLFLER